MHISTEEINYITDQIKILLQSLNNFLCDHIDTIPMNLTEID